jgi:hypothetical protein
VALFVVLFSDVSEWPLYNAGCMEQHVEIHSMKSYKDILDDITCDTCANRYCILKEVLLRMQHPDSRSMLQIKCVDKFKYEKSETAGKDIGWDKAFDQWCDEGYAKAFADVYEPDITLEKIYSAVLKIVRAATKPSST